MEEIRKGKYTEVYSTDELSAGNAHCEYLVSTERGTSISDGVVKRDLEDLLQIKFQNGSILESGVNGIMNEDLISIVIDRLQGFQGSKFACRENALALTKLEEALMWLEYRTAKREKRGVEGTHTV